MHRMHRVHRSISPEESQEPAVLPAADCCSVPVDIPFSVCKRRVGVAIGFSNSPGTRSTRGSFSKQTTSTRRLQWPCQRRRSRFLWEGKFALELNEVPRDSARRSWHLSFRCCHAGYGTANFIVCAKDGFVGWPRRKDDIKRSAKEIVTILTSHCYAAKYWDMVSLWYGYNHKRFKTFAIYQKMNILFAY